MLHLMMLLEQLQILLHHSDSPVKPWLLHHPQMLGSVEQRRL
jgi:hypothetical protein